MLTKVIIALSLSATALFGFGLISYIWTKQKSDILTQSNDLSYKKKEGYIVWGPHCKIPDFKPLDESIIPFLETYKLENCSDKPLLTSIVRNRDSHTLILHDEYKHYYTDKPEELECCYSIVRRKEPRLLKVPEKIEFQTCTPLVKNVSFSKDEQFVFIECKEIKPSNRTEEKIVYKNTHNFIRRSKETLNKTHIFQRKNKKDLNIYIIGIDSVSRLSFLRTMPNTFKGLSKDWVELKGYNKIASNTFPNTIAATTGSNISTIRETCMEDYDLPLDSCDFIWKNLSNRGYTTMFAEDETYFGIFNYAKFGFLQAPTDHYMHPFFMAAKNRTDEYPEKPFHRCLGPEYIIEHLFNYLFDFTVEYQEDLKFAFLWANSFSHENVNGPSAWDDKYVSFFDKLKKLGVYESSLIVFLSDHGARYGDIRLKNIGWYEERLPFIFFHFPEWWIKENPQKYKNLQSNSDKLTSPYDLYLTLRDTVEGESKEGTPSCPNCRSLLTPIPWDRSCDDAGIPYEWCTCQQHIEIEIDEVVTKAAPHIVYRINEILSEIPVADIEVGYRCAELEFKSVKKALKRIPYSEDEFTYNDYIITVQTTPGNQLFEGNIRHTIEENVEKFEILGVISRVNKYGQESECVFNHPVILVYCYCQEIP